MGQAVRIEMAQGVLEYADEPLCTDAQIDAALRIVELHEDDLFALLPPDHIWNRGKREHMSQAHEAKQPIVDQFSRVLAPVNFRLLDFIFRVHDLGRVYEGAVKLGSLPEYLTYCGDHARQSVLILDEWGALDCFSEETRSLITYVIEHHVGPETPTLPDAPSASAAAQYLFTCLLRDCDKYIIFSERTAQYLHDDRKRAAEMEIHHLRELGRIEPIEFLDTFQNHRTPDKTQMVSYEAYMLYFLSWIYDVNPPSVLKAIVASGAIELLLEYFRQQLPQEIADQIESSVTTYLDRHHVSLVV